MCSFIFTFLIFYFQLGHLIRSQSLLEPLTYRGTGAEKIGRTRWLIDEGADSYNAIVNGLARGMAIVSNLYEKGEAFVPHLLFASGAMYAGIGILTPAMKTEFLIFQIFSICSVNKKLFKGSLFNPAE